MALLRGLKLLLLKRRQVMCTSVLLMRRRPLVMICGKVGPLNETFEVFFDGFLYASSKAYILSPFPRQSLSKTE